MVTTMRAERFYADTKTLAVEDDRLADAEMSDRSPTVGPTVIDVTQESVRTLNVVTLDGGILPR
jgi:hypothetical protein